MSISAASALGTSRKTWVEFFSSVCRANTSITSTVSAAIGHGQAGSGDLFPIRLPPKQQIVFNEIYLTHKALFDHGPG